MSRNARASCCFAPEADQQADGGGSIANGMTLIPLNSIHTMRGRAKLLLAFAKGKKLPTSARAQRSATGS